jgi:hypothetical protein
MVQRKVQQTTKASTKLRLQRLYSIKTLLFCLFFFVACTSSHQWSAVHPSYKKAPSPEESIGMVGLESAFILTRAKWFSNRLEISMDSIHSVVDSLMTSNFTNEFKNYHSQVLFIPDSVKKNWPTESQKLDKSIFLKGQLPAQGIVIKNDTHTPPYLFILHEFVIGTDLDRSLYYDYTQGGQEVEVKTSVKHVTAILSYTLWDNLKQIPLFSSVIEIQEPYTNKLTETYLKQITQKAVKEIHQEISRRKSP